MTKVAKSIDRLIERDQSSGFRAHLGASILGRACAREVWYIFRWAKVIRHEARLLRLFDRGNLAEPRFVDWLRRLGVTVHEKDPDTGKQFRVSALDGHMGGSLDARLYGIEDVPDQWCVGEFKTHNDKSFKNLKKSGVAGAKWEHYVQMQLYMYLTGMLYALYLAINKNDDEVYSEVVARDDNVALEYLSRAYGIIVALRPPRKINDSPGWYQCKFCDYSNVCHSSEPLAVNCRTCVHSMPTQGGTWTCQKYNYLLTEENQRQGCADHEPIR